MEHVDIKNNVDVHSTSTLSRQHKVCKYNPLKTENKPQDRQTGGNGELTKQRHTNIQAVTRIKITTAKKHNTQTDSKAEQKQTSRQADGRARRTTKNKGEQTYNKHTKKNNTRKRNKKHEEKLQQKQNTYFLLWHNVCIMI